jgi:hypothetical protein
MERHDNERELMETLERFESVLRGAHISAGSSSVNVNVQDSKRVTVAVCCAIFSAVMFLAMVIIGSVLYIDMADHLDAIYMIAPSLNHPTPGVTHEQHP